MTPEFKAAWIAKLRDPETKQGRGRLEYFDGSQCCLGIAANLAGVRKIPSRENFQFIFGDRWINPGLPPRGWMGLSDDDIAKLVQMNDHGRTFPEIADWIEDNIEAQP